VVSVTSVSTGVDTRLLCFLNLLVFQALFDFEKLLSCAFDVGMSNDSDRVIPGWTLRTQEVAINFFFNLGNYCLGMLVVWIVVLFPPVEAGLIFRVIQLTVMN